MGIGDIKWRIDCYKLDFGTDFFSETFEVEQTARDRAAEILNINPEVSYVNLVCEELTDVIERV